MADIHTTKDVIDILMTVKEQLAVNGAKTSAIHEDVGEIRDHIKIQNGRIGVLEKKWWVLSGGIVVAIGVAKLLIG